MLREREVAELEATAHGWIRRGNSRGGRCFEREREVAELEATAHGWIRRGNSRGGPVSYTHRALPQIRDE